LSQLKIFPNRPPLCPLCLKPVPELNLSH
jgi:hypothetical protein